MAEVFNFEQEARRLRDIVFHCACDGCTFFIHSSGAIECSSCGEYQIADDVYTTVRDWVTTVRRYRLCVDNFVYTTATEGEGDEN